MSHRSLILALFALAPTVSVGCHCAHRPFLVGDCCDPAPGPVGPVYGGPVIAATPAVPFGFGGPTGVPVGAGPVAAPGCASCGASPLVGAVKPAGYPVVPPPVIASSGPETAPHPAPAYSPGTFGAIPAPPPPAPGSVFTGPPTTIVPPPVVTPAPTH